MENSCPGPDREGVIKYHLDHSQAELADAIDIAEINAWRCVFFRLRLIGQIAEKYDGLGFGNISQRLVAEQPAFIVTGTQTGHLPCLAKRDFALVEAASPANNYLRSQGLSKPSSEALTHATIYLSNPTVTAVIHVHCPEIWRNSKQLKVPCTGADVPYGTPEMAEAVVRLFKTGRLQPLGLFSMLGHQDGVVAFGPTLASAASLLIEAFALALAIEQKQPAP